MAEKLHSFFNDDGTPINPNLMPKPSLCATCRHDGDPNQETLRALNRIDQQGEDDFRILGTRILGRTRILGTRI